MNEMFMLENALIEDQHIRFYDTTDDSDSDSGGPQISSIWRDMRAVFEAIGTALAPRQSETESHEESPPMQTGARTRARDWFWPPAQVANPTREQVGSTSALYFADVEVVERIWVYRSRVRIVHKMTSNVLLTTQTAL